MTFFKSYFRDQSYTKEPEICFATNTFYLYITFLTVVQSVGKKQLNSQAGFKIDLVLFLKL